MESVLSQLVPRRCPNTVNNASPCHIQPRNRVSGAHWARGGKAATLESMTHVCRLSDCTQHLVARFEKHLTQQSLNIVHLITQEVTAFECRSTPLINQYIRCIPLDKLGLCLQSCGGLNGRGRGAVVWHTTAPLAVLAVRFAMDRAGVVGGNRRTPGGLWLGCHCFTHSGAVSRSLLLASVGWTHCLVSRTLLALDRADVV